jgi:hypothetical protein
MKPHGGSRRESLTEELDYHIARAEQIVEQVRALDVRTSRRHAARPERPKLTLIRGGRAVLVAPLVWVWAQLRDHASASVGLAAAGVIGVPTALGVAAPVIHSGAPPVSMSPRISEDVDPRPLPVGLTAPSPEPTPTVEVVEPEVSPPDPPAPTSAPTPLPTPTPTVTPPLEAVEPVEEIVWTKAEALVHCREVLLADDLRGCVRELLAG